MPTRSLRQWDRSTASNRKRSAQRIREPVAIKRIEDSEAFVLWEYDETTILSNRVPFLQEEVAYIVNDALSDPSTRWPTLGRDNILETQQRAAIVNGLTSDGADNWTVGYTPDMTAAVHLSRASGGGMSLEAFGVEGAAHVWRAIMDYLQARDSRPNSAWERPETIIETLVCQQSGQSPNAVCPTRTEIFLDGGQIPPEDSYWTAVDINTETGQLATVNTPPALSVERAYFIPPPEAQDWWVANGLPLPPEVYDTTSVPDLVSSTIILQPADLEIVGGEIDIRGSLDADGMDFFQVSFGEGLNPEAWFDISDPRTDYVRRLTGDLGYDRVERHLCDPLECGAP